MLSPNKKKPSQINRNNFEYDPEFKRWWETQRQRKLNIEKTCQKYGSALQYNINKNNLMYDPNHKLLFCRNAKVRSIYIYNIKRNHPFFCRSGLRLGFSTFFNFHHQTQISRAAKVFIIEFLCYFPFLRKTQLLSKDTHKISKSKNDPQFVEF